MINVYELNWDYEQKRHKTGFCLCDVANVISEFLLLKKKKEKKNGVGGGGNVALHIKTKCARLCVCEREQESVCACVCEQHVQHQNFTLK